MYQRSLSQQEVDHAADVLEVEDSERTQMHAFYARERRQDRDANIKLLKALGVFALKVIAIFLVSYALFQTWTERIPK